MKLTFDKIKAKKNMEEFKSVHSKPQEVGRVKINVVQHLLHNYFSLGQSSKLNFLSIEKSKYN